VTKIQIRPSWVFTTDGGDEVDPQLFRVLRGIHDGGKLTFAARQAGISYRHAWDLLGKWSRFFGTPLARMERGRGATLTALGAKLLWAEQRSDASLFPHLETIASELNVEIRRAVQDARSVIRIHASHGYAIEKLPSLLADHARAAVDIHYTSSVAALAALSRGECELAGFHVPLGELGEELWKHYAKWLHPRQQRIVKMVTRTQGLILASGNPLGITSIADLARPGLRFVNRQAGSGTRILLDGLLARAGVDARDIQGYSSGEFTHAAVAAFVASGMADVAFAIEPAARRFRLDFLPVVQERYMLAAHRDRLRLAAVRELLALLRGPLFLEAIAGEPGYAPDHPGEVVAVEEIFPWDAP
jgi:molybdate transport repressor ModE-like protein